MKKNIISLALIIILFSTISFLSTSTNASVTIDPLSLFLKETKILYDMDMNQRGYGKYHYRQKHNRFEYRTKTLYHKIRNGENLSIIAKRYRTKVSKLIRINNIASPNKIYIGQKIKIRVGKVKKNYRSRYRKQYREKRHPISKKQKKLRWPLFTKSTKKKRFKKSRRFPGILIRAKKGDRIRSAGAGKIVRISSMRGYGKYIIIAHANHLLTVYSSLGKVKVKLGQSVSKGEIIASTVKKYSSSLRFQVAYYGRPVNPLKFLKI